MEGLSVTTLLRLEAEVEDLQGQLDALADQFDHVRLERFALVRVLTVLFPSHRVQLPTQDAVCVHLPDVPCVWPIEFGARGFAHLPALPPCAAAVWTQEARLARLAQSVPLPPPVG
jgi:hypothetical protein